ncbi:zinc-dependent metalloprotease family protein [Flavobacterium pectinovorum]|uniref:zinc-dependent metalloprotease family protein n=1 Tax=Flavobacterium pectinovorum TaxID=29533 RepID=UPI001FADC06F|nr:zinc-dependent metalloprotease family protein [Flavobacterium pectinovorum]MCI9846259.1 Zn-dependent protease [Flavobacterium pectinovorum]
MKYYTLILLFSLLSCTNKKNDSDDKEFHTQRQKVIVIQPLGNFKLNQAEKVFKQIKAINSNVVLRQNISFPENSFYKPRNRYRADSIIKNLKNNIGVDSVIVGLANADVSTTKNGIKDWGVMGLGYKPGKACVVSDFRLSVKNKNEQFYKLVLHELGHTAGLPHCKIKTCLMRDAEGGNPFDQEKSFCRECKSFLKSKGWQLI